MNSINNSLPADQRQIFKKALRGLNASGLPYVVGGAFAVQHYTGIWRNTKDLDIHVTPNRRDEAMDIMAKLGFQTFIKFEPWLAKATLGPYYIDIVYGMGNWLAPVDQVWIDKASPGALFRIPVSLAPPEEIIWHKAFVAARDRHDGGDINHIIAALRGNIDWRHLEDRFNGHWELLLSTLVTFRYVYPSHRDYIPEWVLRELLNRLQRDLAEPWTGPNLCRGTLLDPTGTYSPDVESLGYYDARKQA